MAHKLSSRARLLDFGLHSVCSARVLTLCKQDEGRDEKELEIPLVVATRVRQEIVAEQVVDMDQEMVKKLRCSI